MILAGCKHFKTLKKSDPFLNKLKEEKPSHLETEYISHTCQQEKAKRIVQPFHKGITVEPTDTFVSKRDIIAKTKENRQKSDLLWKDKQGSVKTELQEV